MTVRFDHLEVHGVKDYGEHCEQVPDDEADFFSVYGRLPKDPGPDLLVCIGDMSTREAAELTVELLGFARKTTGNVHDYMGGPECL